MFFFRSSSDASLSFVRIFCSQPGIYALSTFIFLTETVYRRVDLLTRKDHHGAAFDFVLILHGDRSPRGNTIVEKLGMLKLVFRVSPKKAQSLQIFVWKSLNLMMQNYSSFNLDQFCFVK